MSTWIIHHEEYDECAVVIGAEARDLKITQMLDDGTEVDMLRVYEVKNEFDVVKSSQFTLKKVGS